MKHENLLMVGDSERDADMLYAVRMFVPDPVIYLRAEERTHVAVSDLELGRARRLARHCRILRLSQYFQRLRRARVALPSLAHVIREILRERRLKKVVVPAAFPLGLARQLRQLKVKVRVRDGLFFPERQFKSAEEVKKISAALMMAEVGLAEGLHLLKNAKIAKNGRLLHHGAPLTSEKLRSTIDTAVLQAGGIALHTIVAGGVQACDPHEPGHGPLRANDPIIIDVFPRSQKTGYYGDISRTVVKGRASEGVRRLFHTVACAQELAFAKVESGALAREVHESVQDFFGSEGYPKRRRNGRPVGFFHGTGHGIGLDLHEFPRIGPTSPDVLLTGHVVSIEPGLYYPQLGGVRLEDVVLVTTNSARNLTKFEKVLEV